MTSLDYPVMFNNAKTLVATDKKATANNLTLLLKSSKNSLFGDPYFGTNLMEIAYSQNNAILSDIIIDEIYTSILEYIPQLKLTRDDIKVQQNSTELTASIRATNSLDSSTNMYGIKLMVGDDQINQQ